MTSSSSQESEDRGLDAIRQQLSLSSCYLIGSMRHDLLTVCLRQYTVLRRENIGRLDVVPGASYCSLAPKMQSLRP